jgi:hypothetical protein
MRWERHAVYMGEREINIEFGLGNLKGRGYMNA